MIELFTGTPGSGKSLHMAEGIFYDLFAGRPVIGNFEFNDSLVKFKKSRYHYVPNWELTPDFLKEFSVNYQREHGACREDYIRVYIDEAQLLFNARDYNSKDRREWLQFFTLHRHYKLNIVLACQFDRMLDRQVRCLVEYEYIHRKLKNMGWKGRLVDTFLLFNNYIVVRVYKPINERLGFEFFKFKKKYAKCYDTYALNIGTDIKGVESDVTSPDPGPEVGDMGDPPKEPELGVTEDTTN